jgi:CRP-like cAMP-binding protein
MIVRKGESVKCFFIILSGEVKYDTNPLGEGSGRMTSARITDDTEDATDVDSGASDSAQVLGENDFFGAESVLNDAVQAASVRAITNTAVCKMDRSLFFNEKAYGPMRKIVSKAIKDREEDQKSRLQGADRFIRPQGSSRKVKKGDPERLSKWDDPSDEHEGSTPAARRFKKLDDDDPPEYSGFSCGVFSINLL